MQRGTPLGDVLVAQDQMRHGVARPGVLDLVARANRELLELSKQFGPATLRVVCLGRADVVEIQIDRQACDVQMPPRLSAVPPRNSSSPGATDSIRAMKSASRKTRSSGPGG